MLVTSFGESMWHGHNAVPVGRELLGGVLDACQSLQ